MFLLRDSSARRGSTFKLYMTFIRQLFQKSQQQPYNLVSVIIIIEINERKNFVFNCSSDVQMKVSTILDDIGEASAIAQCLNKPVTSTSKLQDTDHIVYLLVDSSGNR